MTQRHRRRHTCFAWKYLPSVLRREQTEIEKVDLELGFLDYLGRDLNEPKSFRHLAGTGLIVTRRPTNQEYARCPTRILVALLSLDDLLAGIQPLNRQL